MKCDGEGKIDRFKSRLVAKGHSQRYGIDFVETFAPVVRHSSVRTLLAYAVQNHLIIHQMDVITAFLNGMLDEDIYMQQPEGYEIQGKENLVCKTNLSMDLNKHQDVGTRHYKNSWSKQDLSRAMEILVFTLVLKIMLSSLQCMLMN